MYLEPHFCGKCQEAEPPCGLRKLVRLPLFDGLITVLGLIRHSCSPGIFFSLGTLWKPSFGMLAHLITG